MVDNLYELIKKNSSLEFLNAKSGKIATLAELEEEYVIKSNKERKLIFLYLENDKDSIIALLSCIKSNHVISLLNNKLDIDLKVNLENRYKPNIIFDGERTSIQGYFKKEKGYFYETHLAKYSFAAELKFLLSTSGTTGSPKFVKLSESNLLQNAISILDYLPITNSDVTPLNLPIYYSYGLSILTTNSMKGGTLVYNLDDIIQRGFWKDFEKYGFNSIAGVPFVYEMLKKIGFTKKTYPSLKYMTQAGGKLEPNYIQHYADYCEKNNVLFYVMYGQTEGAARLSYLKPSVLKNKIGSIGKPILNGEFKLEKETGEIIYKGPNVFGGYANEITDLDFFESNKTLHTGDLGRVDEEGYYYVTGRLKRFAKYFGLRVNLDEIQSYLSSIYSDSEFVLSNIDDKKLLIVSSESIDFQKIKENIISKYKLHPSVIRYFNIEKIPLTSNSKIDYKRIKEIYESK